MGGAEGCYAAGDEVHDIGAGLVRPAGIVDDDEMGLVGLAPVGLERVKRPAEQFRADHVAGIERCRRSRQGSHAEGGKAENGALQGILVRSGRASRPACLSDMGMALAERNTR